MSDFDEEKIKTELDDIFGKIDQIVKRINTEAPENAENEPDQPVAAPPSEESAPPPPESPEE